MPPGTVKVDRTTRFGNPFVVGKPHPYCTAAEVAGGHACARPLTAEEAVELFRCLPVTDDDLDALRGKNVACWCGLDAPCHGDVWLARANPTEAAE